MRGRRPRPAELHLAEGTFRDERHGDRAAVRDEIRLNQARPLPAPPAWLSQQAKREWRLLARLLRDRGILNPLYRGVMAGYADAAATVREATEVLKQAGLTTPTRDGFEKLNPAVAIRNKAQSNLRSFANELGLSPLSRSSSRDDDDDDDGAGRIDVGPKR
jgi:P27 family predicted phage terminase small subunit